MQKKLRVYELARELNLDNSEVIRELQHMGVPVTSHSNTVEDRLADTLRKRLRTEVVEVAPPAHVPEEVIETAPVKEVAEVASTPAPVKEEPPQPIPPPAPPKVEVKPPEPVVEQKPPKPVAPPVITPPPAPP